MQFHYNRHYEGYVVNTNNAVANATANGISVQASNLTSLIRSVGRLPAPLNNTVRNQGGGAWNHALFFKQLAPSEGHATGLGEEGAISQPLKDAISLSFGTVDDMVTELTAAARQVFGSGWAWPCYTGNTTAPLAITTTPNQDNPLMGQLPGAPPVTAAGCTPILVIDV
ncbi:hypothetical protein COO60DRAFT_383582 [Scenedesmus sp. NREL 46B-D3]|nr:hypothetical protein COO60DRAFT_383582 [Scenedesmus sp. NREL 46B-D3]